MSKLYVRVCGIVLLLSAFLPLAVLFPGNRAAAEAPLPRIWLLGVFIAAAAGVLGLIFRGRLSLRLGALPAAGILAAEAAAVSYFAFSDRYHLIDSVVQLFQARLFASGEASQVLPGPASFFLIQNMILEPGGRWYSQYPPLHSLLLAAGELAGFVRFVPILAAVLTALLIWGITGRLYGPAARQASIYLVLLCPFFVFLGTSYMNHISAAMFLALSLYCAARSETGRRPLWAAASGASLGAVFLVRPLDAAAGGAALAAAAFGARRCGALRGLIYGAAAAGAVSSLILVYNGYTTGSAFLPGYLKLWGESHGLGFHDTPWGETHTFTAGLGNQLGDLALLQEYLFEWPMPALLPLALFLLFAPSFRRQDLLLLTGFVAQPAAQLFYWHRDAFLGPRFLFSSLVFLLPLYARVIVSGSEVLPACLQAGSRSSKLLRWWSSTVAVCFLYAVLVGIPMRFVEYRSSLASMKTNLAVLALQQGITDAVIFVPVSWGNRLLAQLRQDGLPAAAAEKAYRKLDHCRLFRIMKANQQAGRAAGELEKAVNEMLVNARPVQRVNLGGDPSLRLEPGVPLAPECAAEIRYDQQGFMDYTAHLLDNRADLRGSIVVARDMRERNSELLAAYPGKRGYLYRGGRFTAMQ